MIQEIFIYAASLPGTPSGFRRHVSEAVGLWARGKRQHRAWADHTMRARTFIEAIIHTLPGHGTVAVLGSGPLFDVPLEMLAKNFQRVLLIDRTHLLPARLRMRRYKNVACQWRDLSTAQSPAPLEFLNEIPDLDWVISLNLLSQLALSAIEGHECAEVDAHLAALDALPCAVTLITDTHYDVRDREGALWEEVDMLHDGTLPPPDAQWSWEVAPFGEENANTRRMHRVSAYRNWGRTHQAASGHPQLDEPS